MKLHIRYNANSLVPQKRAARAAAAAPAVARARAPVGTVAAAATAGVVHAS